MSVMEDTEEETFEESISSGYQSLYLKYRPRRFADLVGQQKSILPLKNILSSGDIAHGYMFSGTRGTGKTTSARLFAASLNCNFREQGSIEPCGECDECRPTLAGTSDVVREINCAESRGLHEMREALESVALSTFGNYRIYIFDEVHMLTKEASSLFLKTLEEPPNPRVIFILATTDPDKVLQTIQSRTVKVRFGSIQADDLKGLCLSVNESEGLNLTDEQINAAVSQGRGSARDCLSAIESIKNGGLSDSRELFLDITEATVDRDLGKALLAIAKGEKDSTLDPSQILSDLWNFWRDVLILKSNPDLVDIQSDLLEMANDAAKSNSLVKITRNLEVMAQASSSQRISSQNRIVLEGAIAKLLVPGARDQFDGIMDYLEDFRDEINEKFAKMGKSVPVDNQSGPDDYFRVPENASGEDSGDEAADDKSPAVDEADDLPEDKVEDEDLDSDEDEGADEGSTDEEVDADEILDKVQSIIDEVGPNLKGRGKALLSTARIQYDEDTSTTYILTRSTVPNSAKETLLERLEGIDVEFGQKP